MANAVFKASDYSFTNSDGFDITDVFNLKKLGFSLDTQAINAKQELSESDRQILLESMAPAIRERFKFDPLSPYEVKLQRISFDEIAGKNNFQPDSHSDIDYLNARLKGIEEPEKQLRYVIEQRNERQHITNVEKDVIDDIKDDYSDIYKLTSQDEINKQIDKAIAEYNKEVFKDKQTSKGKYANVNADGQELSQEQLNELRARFYKDVIRDPKAEVERMNNFNVTDLDESEERYVILKQQFNNPELLERTSPDTYNMIMSVKADPKLDDDEKLKKYFELADNNAVLRGGLQPHEAKFYTGENAKDDLLRAEAAILGNQNTEQSNPFFRLMSGNNLQSSEMLGLSVTDPKELDGLHSYLQQGLNENVEKLVHSAGFAEFGDKMTNDVTPQMQNSPALSNDKRNQNRESLSPRQR